MCKLTTRHRQIADLSVKALKMSFNMRISIPRSLSFWSGRLELVIQVYSHKWDLLQEAFVSAKEGDEYIGEFRHRLEDNML